MRKLQTLFHAAFVALAISFAGGLVASAQDAPAGDLVEGKRLYLAVGCFACHGRAGQGGFLNGPAPILAGTQLPFEGFKGQLRQPVRDMPAYSEAVMSDKQVADVYAFVQSLSGPLPVKDTAVLKD